MRIWAVANQKGGVGKTTTTVTLGGLLAGRGQRVLLVDLDPHGSLSAYFRHDPDAVEASVYRLFQPDGAALAAHPEALLRDTGSERLWLIPASSAMATLDRQIGAREGMGLVLQRLLTTLASRFDFVLLDCPPTLGVLMINALGACHHLIIPVQTEFLALQGLERMLRTLAMLQRAGREVPYTIVPTMFDRRTHASCETLAQLRSRFAGQGTLWNGAIPVDTQLREASRRGAPLSALARTARSVVAYSELLDSLLAPAAFPQVAPAG
jgi:chromosome partitioning protein